MKLQLHGKNFTISDQVEKYVQKKIGGLERYLSDLQEARVEIRQEHTRNAGTQAVVQATLRANKIFLRAEERTDTVYAAIDLVANKIHRQVARYKGKREDRRHGQKHYHQTPPQEKEVEEDLLLDEEIVAELVEESTREIVRVKQFLVTPMNEEEAVEQMELLGHDFFIFFNANLGRINVLYRRSDQDYGLLDPQLA